MVFFDPKYTQIAIAALELIGDVRIQFGEGQGFVQEVFAFKVLGAHRNQGIKIEALLEAFFLSVKVMDAIAVDVPGIFGGIPSDQIGG